MKPYIEYDPRYSDPVLLQQASALGRGPGMKSLDTDAEIEKAFALGDIVSFPPCHTKFHVVANNPLTIEPLHPIRMPGRYIVTTLQPKA